MESKITQIIFKIGTILYQPCKVSFNFLNSNSSEINQEPTLAFACCFGLAAGVAVGATSEYAIRKIATYSYSKYNTFQPIYHYSGNWQIFESEFQCKIADKYLIWADVYFYGQGDTRDAVRDSMLNYALTHHSFLRLLSPEQTYYAPYVQNSFIDKKTYDFVSHCCVYAREINFHEISETAGDSKYVLCNDFVTMAGPLLFIPL
jgi:hypothetical protein